MTQEEGIAVAARRKPSTSDEPVAAADDDYRPPKLTYVDALGIRDSQITWSSAGTESQLSVDTIILAWEAAPASGDLDEGGSRFITFCLKEQADATHPSSSSPSPSPFELVALVSRAIPAQLREKHLLRKLPGHLCYDGGDDERGRSLEVTVVVSTGSGTGQASAFWNGVVQPLFELTTHDIDISVNAGGATPVTKSITDKQAKRIRPRVLITQNVDSVSHFARTLASTGEGDAATLTPTGQSPTPKRKTIVLLSGDGGVVDLLNGRGNDDANEDENKDKLPQNYTSPQPTITLIPIGTGNALFHSLHSTLAPLHGDRVSPLVLSLRTLFRGKPAPLPSFRAAFSPGCLTVPPSLDVDQSAQDAGVPKLGARPITHIDGAIVASFGFHASVVYESDTPAHRRHGIKRFGLVAQELLRESHPYAARVEVRRPANSSSPSPSSVHSPSSSSTGAGFVPLPRETHAYVLATVVSHLERTFNISPASRPLDGKLRLVHFGPVGGERTMQAMAAAYDGGRHVDLAWDDGEAVGYEEVEGLRVVTLDEAARWRKICVDGTIIEMPVGGSLTVTRRENSGFDIVVDSSLVHS